ncbi:sulfotransferase [Phenylobacterium sp.]|uniref:sulfotransferase n=1 Tax=Phenylobacterium sp. TaxID=1871053 RepID=UPI0035AD87D7
MSSKDMPVIGLHGAPRSGTSWIGQIFNSAPEVAYRFQPFFAYAFHERADNARTAGDLDAILRDIALTDDAYILQTGERRLAQREVSFAKAAPQALVYKEVRFHHLLPQLMEIDRFSGVGIVRDPIDVLSSWIKAPREFKPEWSVEAEWRFAASKNGGRPEEFYGYEGWKRAALLFEDLQAKAPRRFRILSYDALLDRPLATVTALFEALGLPMSGQVEAFVESSTASADDDPYGVFRDISLGRSPSILSAAIQDWIREDVQRSGLGRHLRAR